MEPCHIGIRFNALAQLFQMNTNVILLKWLSNFFWVKSLFDHVYQSLANLIRWSDRVMLCTDNQPVNKETAADIINAVKDGINVSIKSGAWN